MPHPHLGENRRHFRDKGWSVRVPGERLRGAQQVSGANDELTSELSRLQSRRGDCQARGRERRRRPQAWSPQVRTAPCRSRGGGSSDDDDAPSVIDHYATGTRTLPPRTTASFSEDAIGDFSPREGRHHMRFFGHDAGQISRRTGISQVQVSHRLLRFTFTPRAGQNRGSHGQWHTAPGLKRRRFLGRRNCRTSPAANGQCPALHNGVTFNGGCRWEQGRGTSHSRRLVVAWAIVGAIALFVLAVRASR